MDYVIRATALAAFVLAIGTTAALAQVTGTPSFHAPVRPFQKAELGGVVSFPEPSGTGWEMTYRGLSGAFDVGIRGGVLEPTTLPGTVALAGFDARSRVIRHGRTSPLDLAVIFGAGGRIRRNASSYSVPLGISLGRRIGGANATISLAPYVQPTIFLQGGNGMQTGIRRELGIGTDIRVRNSMDIRFSLGVGTLKGFSIGAILIH